MTSRRVSSFSAGSPASQARGLFVLALASLCHGLACGGDATRSRDDGETAPGPSGSNLAPGPGGTSTEEAAELDENGQLMLDDLVDGDALFAAGGISGEWFTYSDGTSPLTPPDHTGLPAVDGEAHVAGQGFSDWGAGLSAYLRSADLSGFDRVLLRARGSGTIVVEVATPETSPPAEGGTCMGQGCFGHFSAPIQLEEQYQDFELTFSTFAQPSWAQPAEFSLGRVISINLVAKVVGAAANIDLWVDRLALGAAP